MEDAETRKDLLVDGDEHASKGDDIKGLACGTIVCVV
jgi:hypothetical protein